jgi:hypothetical protein
VGGGGGLGCIQDLWTEIWPKQVERLPNPSYIIKVPRIPLPSAGHGIDCRFVSPGTDVTIYVRRTRFVAVSVTPNTWNPLSGSSSVSLTPAVRVLTCHRKWTSRNGNASEPGTGIRKAVSPLESPIPLAKAADAQRSICFRTVTAKKIRHLCFGCYRFFLSFSDTLFVRLAVSTEPRGLGAGLDRSFRHMSHASHAASHERDLRAGTDACGGCCGSRHSSRWHVHSQVSYCTVLTIHTSSKNGGGVVGPVGARSWARGRRSVA